LASGSGGPIDVEKMVREAREARSQFKRVIATGEISAWKKRGSLVIVVPAKQL
jgi:hypothetical protein